MGGVHDPAPPRLQSLRKRADEAARPERHLVQRREGRVRRPERGERGRQDHSPPPPLCRRAGQRGEIEVAGFDVRALRRSDVPRLRRSLGIVFQDAKLLSGRTVFENIAFVLRVLGTPRREITPKAFQALKAVGLSSRAQAYPAQLSQGEAQRAALARAIVKSPALLLADEPTGNLDEAMAGEILDLIKDIGSRGTTVLLATHQARLATQLKRRTLKLGGGVLLKDEG